MSQGLSSLDHNLSHHTSFFGIKLWIFIVACILAIAVLFLVLLSLYFIYCRHRKPPRVHINSLRPIISKNSGLTRSLDKRLLSRNGADIELSIETPEKRSELTGLRCGRAVSVRKREKHGYAYALREVEAATNGFADVNVIGSGDFGIVYHGVLFDGTRVAIKKLLYDSLEDKKELPLPEWNGGQEGRETEPEAEKLREPPEGPRPLELGVARAVSTWEVETKPRRVSSDNSSEIMTWRVGSAWSAWEARELRLSVDLTRGCVGGACGRVDHLPALFWSSTNLGLHEEHNGVFKNQIGTDFRSTEIEQVMKNIRIRGKEKSKIKEKRCKDENFIAQVEAIGNVRHKNLVKLLGYCTEGAFRMLVYEYVDNGNLSQWLHGCIRQVSPLTWNMRINVIQAAGKGLAYLHEDIEPKIIHQQIKSSNILLDQQWNPKISDIGIAKVLCPEWSHVATSPMGMSGYIAPEYAYTRGNETEVYLIDWLKCMVANQSFDQVVDPKMPEMPSLKELKRTVLVALRCVDQDVENRPTMGDVIHMLEPRDLLLSDVRAFLSPEKP
ncbi:protein kinase superfamily protein [Actinidia rufa]|uniref:non-specific serine/threonine protein kinase n=1 Tax=Actinidia rufa TaxID=165716 RepID=A0A7J0G6N5_9ERIC|nr:protein kinase superfamily protein [Actinidia rufa]